MNDREKFEAWAVSPESWCAGIERHGDSYKAVVTAASWEAFKAARKQALEDAEQACIDQCPSGPSIGMADVSRNQGIHACVEAVRQIGKEAA